MRNKTEKERINSLTLDLSNLLAEFELNQLTKEDLLKYFSDFMQSAGVDSEITVKVLEQENFGKEGKEAALAIKINEGW